MANPIMHFEIISGPGGGEALRNFYAQTFGWEYTVVPDNYALLNHEEGDRGIGGAVVESDAPGVTISIEVDDITAALAQAKANGAEVIEDVTVMPGMVTYAVFRDPAGNTMGLVASEIPPAE